MPPVSALTLNPPTAVVDPGGASNTSLPLPSDAPMAIERAAYSSVAGITVRLLASLPVNLGQNLDAAV